MSADEERAAGSAAPAVPFLDAQQTGDGAAPPVPTPTNEPTQSASAASDDDSGKSESTQVGLATFAAQDKKAAFAAMENDHVSAIDIEEDATNEVVPASQIKVSAGPDPESTFEEYPYLHLPIFQKKDPFSKFIQFFVLGPDVSYPKRGIVPQFDENGRIVREGQETVGTLSAQPPPRRKSVISISSKASADRPWTRYDMYSKGWKTAIIAVCGLTGVLGALTGSVFSPALPYMQAEFGVSTVVANLSLTVGILSLGIMPVLWSPLADLYGRRWVLLVSQVINVIGNLGCFLSPNIGVFLAMRVVSTGGAGAGLAVCSGCIVDIYRKEDRGKSMGMYMLGSLIGPVIAPVIGGSVTQTLGWRYIFIVGIGLASLVFFLTYFLIPETLRGDPSKRRRPNPLRAFYYLRWPFVLFCVLYSSTSFMAFYSFPASVPRDFPRLYGFNAAQVGFVQMALGIGMMFGSVFGGYMTDKAVNSWKAKRGVYVQEDRMRSTALGVICNITGLLFYGWSINQAWPWPVPAVSMILTGYGQMIIGACVGTYFIDVFHTEASSITAMNNCTRFIMGSIAPLIVAPGYQSMGPGGFYTLVAGLALLTSFGIAYVVVFGTKDRIKREPWCLNKELAAKQLAAVESTRGTGFLSRALKKRNKGGVKADEPPEMEEKGNAVAEKVLQDDLAAASA